MLVGMTKLQSVLQLLGRLHMMSHCLNWSLTDNEIAALKPRVAESCFHLASPYDTHLRACMYANSDRSGRMPCLLAGREGQKNEVRR